jgi:hypothetical protein
MQTRIRRAAVRLAAGLAAAALVAGCGDGGSSAVPSGSPDSRHGAEAVDTYSSVELLRAKLVASSDAYYAGGSAEDAGRQLARARAEYEPLAARVRAADPVLDREVLARFGVLQRNLRRGIAPDHYRDITDALTDQLMEGVSQALVKPAARTDPGLQAEALRRVAIRLAATYDAAGAGAGDTTGRLAFQESWGLWRRAQALTALLKPDLDGQKSTVAGALNGLRDTAFPEGPTQPDSPPAARVDKAGVRVVEALNKRFGIGSL